MNKEIFINGRFLTQPLTGVQRYAYELCRMLKSLGVKFVVVMPNRDVERGYNTDGLDIVKWGYGNSHLWEQFFLPFFFYKRKAVLVNFTGLGPVLIFNKVMTIHDIAFYENPLWYSKKYVVFYKLMVPLCAKTSKAILTVSKFSKWEIVKWLHIQDNKISVIYNSTTVREGNDEYPQVDIPKSYFLVVSSIDPRKNLERLVNAFSNLPDFNLIVVGGSCRVFKPTNLRSECRNVKFVGRVSDKELVYLYKNAFAFIYPSLYEGFGIPPIEAMSYGCPVLTSDIEVMHEVCGNAAVFFDPYNVEDIEAKIHLVNSDSELREDLIKRGYDNIKRYSWKSSAQKIMEVVESLN